MLKIFVVDDERIVRVTIADDLKGCRISGKGIFVG
jgi:hypothetical protein